MAAAPKRPKRFGHHDVYIQSNAYRQWSIRVEPGGLQIDTYHDPEAAHVHPPGDYPGTVPVAGLSLQRARYVLESHLLRLGKVVLPILLEELGS